MYKVKVFGKGWNGFGMYTMGGKFESFDQEAIEQRFLEDSGFDRNHVYCLFVYQDQTNLANLVATYTPCGWQLID